MDRAVRAFALPMEGDAAIRIGIHDASRLEWSVSLPFPREGRRTQYAIRVELQIPSNVLARHSPWNQIQSFTRLDGPADGLQNGDAVSIDALRRGALSLAHKLARASEGFARYCRLASSVMLETPPADTDLVLMAWLDSSLRAVDEARERLCAASENEAPELVRERQLVDEYASVRLLEMLAGFERALTAIKPSRHADALAPVVSMLDVRIADALENELARRAELGFISADSASTAELERYLDRASRLKKHFQEVLFLEPDRFEVAQRLHHWVAAFVALVASSWAFVWQIVLTKTHLGAGTTIGSGLAVVALVVGVVYAAKDRIKEVGRAWISGHVHRLYAQRVARFRAPRKRLPSRDFIVTARETIDQSTTNLPDTLNPESGATIPAILIRYDQKGTIEPKNALVDQGVSRIKHVFRYDLSPIFARLDDATKPVPVLDSETRRVRFMEAPRCYRVPVRIEVRTRDGHSEETATVVLHKGGLERLEPRRAP
jgi:hypothetical protein